MENAHVYIKKQVSWYVFPPPFYLSLSFFYNKKKWHSSLHHHVTKSFLLLKNKLSFFYYYFFVFFLSMSTVKVNPHRPYYTPGIHHYNYTSLPSTDQSAPYLLEDTRRHDDLKNFTTRCTSFAFFKYFVTMLTSPFEVGTTLLQVQYSPHEDVEVLGPAILEQTQPLQTSQASYPMRVKTGTLMSCIVL